MVLWTEREHISGHWAKTEQTERQNISYSAYTVRQSAPRLEKALIRYSLRERQHSFQLSDIEFLQF